MTFPPTPYRRRKYGTPAIRWNSFLKRDSNYHPLTPKGSDGKVSRSARKLAAALWQLQMSGGDSFRGSTCLESECGTSDPLKLQIGAGCVNPAVPSGSSAGEKRDGLRAKLESFNMQHPRCVMQEETTNWDPHLSNAIHCTYSYSRVKNIEDRVTSPSVASPLREPEADYDSSKKKVAQWLGKFSEERPSRASREHQKLDAFNGLKKELHRERKCGQTVEMFHSKLINELESVRASAEKFRQDYKKEREARKQLEKVCYELSAKIGEDRTKFEGLKVEFIKLEEEIEEERQMFKMAEMWREERVHMKLMDAKFSLEDKYHKMNKLISEIETFLKHQSSNLSLTDMRKVDEIRQVANSVNVQDLKSCDIRSSFEEVLHIEADERTCKQSLGKYVATDDRCNVEEQALCRQTLSSAEDQVSSSFSQGSGVTIKRLSRGKYYYESAVESEDNGCRTPLNSKITDTCSSSSEQSMQEVSSRSNKIHRTSPSNARIYKVTPHKCIGGLLYSIVSGTGTTSSKRKSVQQKAFGWPVRMS